MRIYLFITCILLNSLLYACNISRRQENSDLKCKIVNGFLRDLADKRIKNKIAYCFGGVGSFAIVCKELKIENDVNIASIEIKKIAKNWVTDEYKATHRGGHILLEGHAVIPVFRRYENHWQLIDIKIESYAD